MELTLYRTYFPHGTNGDIFYNDELICHSIELPNVKERNQISCIPEGKYELLKRFTPKYGWHILAMGIDGRPFIPIHPANFALQELNGAIAPVTRLIGPGEGMQSKSATEKLNQLVFEAISKGEVVYLLITKKENEHSRENDSSNAKVL